MCQSAQTSIVAWAVVTIIALLIITKGRKNGIWNGFFILAFILVQLLEFFIWWQRRKEGLSSSAEEAKQAGPESPENAPSGEAFVRLLLIALWLQPLVQTFMAYRYGNQKYRKQMFALTMVYFILFIWAIIQALDRNNKFQAQPGPDGHLTWSRPGKKGFVGPTPLAVIYFCGLAVGLLFMQPALFGIMLTVLGGIMFAYSAKNYGGGQFSSMWCLYATFYAFLALIMAFSTKVPRK